jgi:hypothetical protein
VSYLSERRARRRRAEWESQIRTWAITTGRSLALDLHHEHPLPVRPYMVGLVLWEGEQPWVEVPVMCSADTPVPVGDGRSMVQVGPWLITSQRVAGRLQPDILRWWTWDQVIGVQVDLTPARERVCLDIDGPKPVYFCGPGAAPLAVAAVYRLHGPVAVIEHPGLVPLRAVAASARKGRRERGTESRVRLAELQPPKPQVPLW